MASKLTEGVRVRVIEMLAEGVGMRAIAKHFKVNYSTAWNWAHSPDIVAELRKLTTGRLLAARNRLGALADKAIDVIAECLDDTNVRVDVRLKAAESVLNRIGVIAEGVDHSEADVVGSNKIEKLIAEADAYLAKKKAQQVAEMPEPAKELQ